MTKLDYGTQISPDPITLSIGRIKKPTLRDISKETFDKFSFYEFLVKMTPEDYYTKLLEKSGGQEQWDKLSLDVQNQLTIYDCIVKDKQLQDMYVELLNFFFIETVIYVEGFFILLKEGCENIKAENLNEDDICGLLAKENLSEVFCLIQQICGIYAEEVNTDGIKFKTQRAKWLFERMQKGNKPKKEKADKNLTLPNIISAICNKHPSLTYTNIWDITLYQLLDVFSRMQNNLIYDLNSTRVSVWGDEKKTFDVSLWYKNIYDGK